jgi:hypothetical protein
VTREKYGLTSDPNDPHFLSNRLMGFCLTMVRKSEVKVKGLKKDNSTSYIYRPWYLVLKGFEIIENVTKSLGVSRPVVRKIVFLFERVREADCVQSLQGDRLCIDTESLFLENDGRKAMT